MNKYYIFLNIIFIYFPLVLGIIHYVLSRRLGLYFTLLLYFAWVNLAIKGTVLGLELTILGHGILDQLHGYAQAWFFYYGILLLIFSASYLVVAVIKNKNYYFIFCKIYAVFLFITALVIFYLMFSTPHYPLRESILLYALGDILTAMVLYLLAFMGQQKFQKSLSLEKKVEQNPPN